MLLPRAALERWRTLAGRDEADADPVRRVVAWLERLAGRMLCSGGRLARLLLESGLVELDDLVACVRAQLVAGPVIAGDALRRDLAMDLDVLAELAPLADLADMSAGAGDIEPEDAEELHLVLARRLLAAGRAGEVEAVLARVGWHRALLGWLADHAADLDPGPRERLFARAADLVVTSHLPAEYHVGALAELAGLSGDRRWLARALEVLTTLPAAALASTPDLEHPVVSIAVAEARLGDLDAALARIEGLPADERWGAHVRLLPLADPGRRAGIVAALLAAMTPEHAWSWIVEVAPETSAQALQAISAIADDDVRRDELCAVARHLRGEAARRACALLLADAAGSPAGSPAWVCVWETLPEALSETGNGSLLDADTLRGAVDTLLARSELDLWLELGPLVPDDRAAAVLARSCAGLERADHYLSRQQWIDLGLPLLPRVPAGDAERWRELAAAAAVGTAIDGAALARLAAWSSAQQRGIILGRLATHQREFLPRQLVDPWLIRLGWWLPPRLCPDWSAWLDPTMLARQREAVEDLAVVKASEAEEQRRLRAALVAITASEAWPEYDEVLWTFALLGRCAGEPGLRAALDGLTELRARLGGAGGEVCP